ncbi:MAG: hypothetical protein DRP78_01390 [Candidatus Omnitrophota bacterium]|nr:MAG: hypothetical protein DRP78_01390 [Candidatus Omnitrophota bacterium]
MGNRNSGFTLLELLIGISIFAVIIVSVYTSLFLGIKVWKCEETRDNSLQEALSSFEQVSVKLQSAFISSDNERIKFVAGPESIDFFSVNTDGDLENVVFYTEINDGSPGLSLLQSITKYTELDDEEEPKIVATVNTKINSFRYSYFNRTDGQWYQDWPDQKKLPHQVKLAADFIDSSANDGLLRLVKYVYIPTGHTLQYSAIE